MSETQNLTADDLALRRFFAEAASHLAATEATQRTRDRLEARRFNVFDLIDPDENKLSDILADLLDPKGTHGQGGLFLGLLLGQLGVEPTAAKVDSAMVKREAPTYSIARNNRRIDVLVECGVVVAIENKVDSSDQADQVANYLEHLGGSVRASGKKVVLIYLTPDGKITDSVSDSVRKTALSEGRLYCWSYGRELRRWLEECRTRCAAKRVEYFLSDFLSYIAAHLQPRSGQEQEKTSHEP